MRNQQQKKLAKRINKAYRKMRSSGKPAQADMLLIRWARFVGK